MASQLDPFSGGSLTSSMEDAWRQFVTFLRQRGDRVTEARKIILMRVLGRHDHFRADELAAEVADGPDRVSRGTVYRTLALLVKAGLVREIRDRDTHVHYEPIFGRRPHEHMICELCGRFIEFEDPELRAGLIASCKKHGFTPRSTHVTVFGICEDCSKTS